MRREVSLEEISDGRLYELNDMVKADCQDCAGCHDCCEGMGDSVVLDPMDVYRLCTNLGKTPQELVSTGLIQFDAMDGNILPHLCMSGKNQCCVFLNEQGRCSIHDFRPGFCRLFPLGRFYENGGFKYFLSVFLQTAHRNLCPLHMFSYKNDSPHINSDFSHWDVSMKMEDLSIFCRSMNVRRQAGARSR